MHSRKYDQSGLSLIVALLMLVAITLLVISNVRNTTMEERMSGNYMDRTRAYQAAEQASSQALAKLQANGDSCLSGCSNGTSGTTTVAGTGPAVTALPTAWSDTGAQDVALASGQATSAKYVINKLPNNSSFLPTGKENCMPYSIMAKGVGLDAASVVVLQAVSFVCPV